MSFKLDINVKDLDEFRLMYAAVQQAMLALRFYESSSDDGSIAREAIASIQCELANAVRDGFLLDCEADQQADGQWRADIKALGVSEVRATKGKAMLAAQLMARTVLLGGDRPTPNP